MGTYKQFTLYERSRIEEGLNGNLSMRTIGALLGRQASSISREVKANRSVLKGRGRMTECATKGECRTRGLCTACGHGGRLCQHCPEKDCRGLCEAYIGKTACQRLTAAPWSCNGCNRYRYGCTRPLRLEYKAVIAEAMSVSRRGEARRGFDMDQAAFEAMMDVVRPAIARGMSPYEIRAAYPEEVTVSVTTLYRWVEAGYGGMANIELERKVGFAPRRHSPKKKSTHHGQERSYEAFCALPEEDRAQAAEMDTVEGRKGDSSCILTLYPRPAHFQLYVLLAAQAAEDVVSALDTLEWAFGLDMFREILGLILTDNGHEFEDTDALEASVTRPGIRRCRVFYCDPRQSQAIGRLREEPHRASTGASQEVGVLRRAERARCRVGLLARQF